MRGSPAARRRAKLDAAVGRAVVGDQNVQLARVLLLGDVVDRLLDRLLLFEAGDDDREGREVEIEAQRRRAVDQQRGDQVRVEVAGQDRDAGDHDQRQRQRDRSGEVFDPRDREPEREARPGEGDADHEEELEMEGDVERPPFLRRSLQFPRRSYDVVAVHVYLSHRHRGPRA